MSFESMVTAFAARFLSDRAFELIVAPALADLQFDEDAGRRSRLANRLAVLRAVAGGFGEAVRRESGSVLKLALLSACYFMYPLAFGFEYFKGWSWSAFFGMISLVVGLSLVPVLVCFWPARHTARPID
jgi:hypothetical protein